MLTRTESTQITLVPGGEALVLDVGKHKLALHLDSESRRMWVGDVNGRLDDGQMVLFRFFKVPTEHHDVWIMLRNSLRVEDFTEEVQHLVDYFNSLSA